MELVKNLGYNDRKSKDEYIMAGKTFLTNLPPEIREELNNRLRKSLYSNLIPIAEWLRENGYKASKSAVGRYAIALKEDDGLAGAGGYAIAARSPIHSDGLSRKEQILIELGALRVRELELLTEFQEL